VPTLVTAKRILIGELTTPHGVRGLMRLRSFAEQPADIFTFNNVVDGAGVPVRFSQRGATKDMFIVAVTGADTREHADAKRGCKLYIDRASLPLANGNTFYIADLEGLAARDTAGNAVGAVVRVLDYGAGPVLEIARTGAVALLLPFTDAFVPTVDMAGGFIIINQPIEIS
jgi:16S rRNA processing protein RimM